MKLLSIEADIRDITNNSQSVIQNSLFLAFPGVHVDARHYIADAIKKGASAVVYENRDGFSYHDDRVPCVGVTDLKQKQADIAAEFYDFPGKKLPIIGVTGTNGKTSVSQFIAQVLPEKCGVIGTLGYGFAHQLKKLQNTTPDGLMLQKILAALIQEGAKNIAMEVSSHGLVENRVANIAFHTAVFTNLTQDHLDFHGTMENYRAAKELLFQKPGLKNAVINIDDAAGQYFAEKYRAILNVVTYSKKNPQADIVVCAQKNTSYGFELALQTPWGVGNCEVPLIGEFNIENSLAVIGAATLVSNDFPAVLTSLATLTPVPGRMQLIQKKGFPSVVIDYAHTPDALEKALQSVRAHCEGRLICVFGCGGNRDKTKRPIMGAIAEKYSDRVIVTNDNPRDEDPDTIAKEVQTGIIQHKKSEIILDRREAIAKAIALAAPQDWILLAGKGHETEQIIGNQILHHSDEECVKETIR